MNCFNNTEVVQGFEIFKVKKTAIFEVMCRFYNFFLNLLLVASFKGVQV